MAATKKPGNPWNQFPKKKAPGKLSTRTPKPTVTPSRAMGAGGPPAAPTAPVKQVKVKDVTPTKPSQQPPTRVGQPAPARPALQAAGANSVSRNPSPTAAQQAASRRSDAASRKAGAALGSRPSGNPVITPPPKGPSKISRAMGAAGSLGQVGTMASLMYGVGSQWQAVNPFDRRNQMKRPGAQPLRQMTAAEMRNAPRLEQYNPDQPKAQANKPKPQPASQPVSSNSSASRSSSRPAPRPPVRSTSPSKPAASQPGQSKDMNENYRAWAAANPKLAAKVKEGQAGYDVVKGNNAPTNDSTASTPNKDTLKSPAGTAQNFRTDISLLDKKKKKVNG